MNTIRILKEHENGTLHHTYNRKCDINGASSKSIHLSSPTPGLYPTNYPLFKG